MNLVISMYSSKYQKENDNFEHFKCITWSPYQRIEVKPVTSFKDLCKGGHQCDRKEQPVWTGVKQCLHLIGLKNENCGFMITDENNGNCVFNILNNDVDYDFYCVLSMRFDPIIHQIHKEGSNPEDEQFISNVKENVVNIISNNLSEDTVCAPFRSLGAEDMVIIFLSKSIKSIINVVDVTRNIQFKYNTETIDLFSTVYMFMGLNNPNCAEEIGVPIIVNFHLKKHNIDEIKNEIEAKLELEGYPDKVEYKEIFRGKGTLQLEIPASIKTDFLFKHKEGILNESSDFHKKNFYSSRVYFKEEFETQPVYNTIDVGINWKTDDELIREPLCCDEKMMDKVGNVEEMSDVAKFIFGEYERMKANNRFCQWKVILDEHYNATLRFISQYMNYDRLTECRLLEQMQSSLHLINQACSPVSDIPYHNYYYTGSFSDLLKAYYGIINMLFSIIYEFPRSKNTFQHKTVFAVRLEAIARIQSEMYTLNGSNDRIIIFSLPYDNFWNYTSNIKLLAHEVFHYAAPYDRIQRNKDILGIIFKIILIRYSKKISDKYSNNDTYGAFSQETREWNAYMLNAYKDDVEIRENLNNILFDKYEQFFTSPAPEWNVIFCKNKNLDSVIRLTANSVQKFITKNAVNVKKHIIKSLKEFKLNSEFEKTMVEEPHNAMCSKIISTISTLSIATKEAFCDIWSIKITKISVTEYILWLFKVMIEIKGLRRIREALAFDYPSLDIQMFSLPIRLYLLLYYDFNEKQGKIFNPAAILRDCINFNEENDEVNICIEEFAKYIDKKVLEYAVYRDELYDMAFSNLYNYFSKAQFTENKEVKTLGEIFKKDLATDVNEEALSQLVYYYAPKRLLNITNNTPYNKNECVKAFGEGFSPIVLDYCYENNTPYIISNLSDYMACLNDIYKKNKTSLEKHSLWYRGICHIDYSLLPSLFRKCDENVSLYANQSNIMKKAYFNSPASTELWNQPIQQKMASLQHYGVPTNLLDFSLDQFVALYFAVNPDYESDRKAIDEGRMRPVVYVFNPIAYSVAVECLKTGNPKKTKIYNLSPVVFDFNQNTQEREKYFVGDMSYNHLVDHTKLYNTTDYIPNPRSDLYPVPMVIEHTTPRIKAQSGVFVAYPLDAQPQSGAKGEQRYHYMDLIKIQTNYNKLMNTCQINAPFLFTIEIRKEAVHSIREELKQFRINSSKYYPEWFRLFENMKD